jgi:hypothetical protein
MMFSLAAMMDLALSAAVGALSSPIGRGHASRPPVSARACSYPRLVARGW